jgi:uncharacterized protein (DUF1330 family)
MPTYYIGEHEITDFAKFDAYLKKTIPIIARFGGKYLTKAGTHEVIEGDWKPNRVVIIEFPDAAAFRGWYAAPEYQPLIAMRQQAGTDVMLLVEGI